MIITIDGLDGCGKSTLAKKLAEKLNFKYIDKPLYQLFSVSGNDNPLYDTLCQMQKAVYSKDSHRLKAWFTGLSLLYVKDILGSQNLIVDRGLLSAYAFNGNASSDPIFDVLLDMGAWFDMSILLYASSDVRANRIKKRNSSDEDLKDDEILNMNYNSIRDFIERNKKLPILYVNTDNMNEEEVFNYVWMNLEKQGILDAIFDQINRNLEEEH